MGSFSPSSPAYVAKYILNAVGAVTAGIPGTAAYPGPTFVEAIAYKNWVIQVTGTFTATVTFYGSIDILTYNNLTPKQKPTGLVNNTAAVWLPIPLDPQSEGGTAVSTATAAGWFTWDKPLIDFGAAVTAFTSGTVTVIVMASP